MPDELPMIPLGTAMVPLAYFLANCPPDIEFCIDDLAETSRSFTPSLNDCDIYLPCDSEMCEGKGDLAFENVSGSLFLDREKWTLTFQNYICRNCRVTSKTIALSVYLYAKGPSGNVLKLGEIPAFGPQVHARVISLIGPDREIFLSGRRAENRGLGIGAFAYYRRVVENQKNRIIREMAKVAKKMDAPEADLKLFEAAESETKFSEAVDKIKSAIPPALRIDGHNPLTLLHKALSDGLHERSDEECLECAREIRLLLTDLAERTAQILKQESELKDAVSKLLSRTSKKPPTPNKPAEE